MEHNKKEAEKHLKDAINATKMKIPISSIANKTTSTSSRSPVVKKAAPKQRIHVEKVKTQVIGSALIVESNKRVAALLKNMLKTLRFDSLIALNGAEAINILKRKKVVIAYVAKELPDISGFTLCSKMRVEEFGKNIPIVITSESTSPSMKDQAIMVDANDHLSTPVSMAGLKASVVDNLVNKNKKKL